MTAPVHAPRYREIESALHARAPGCRRRGSCGSCCASRGSLERAALRVARDDQVLELCRVRSPTATPSAVETAVAGLPLREAARYGLDVGFSVEDNGAISVGSGA